MSRTKEILTAHEQNNQFVLRANNVELPPIPNGSKVVSQTQNIPNLASTSDSSKSVETNILPVNEDQNIVEIQQNPTIDDRYYRCRVMLHRTELPTRSNTATEAQITETQTHSSTTYSPNSLQSANLPKRKPKSVQRFTYNKLICCTCHRKFLMYDIPDTDCFVCSTDCLR